jgi:glycosyltransferase involved in cell wall biosynthesis
MRDTLVNNGLLRDQVVEVIPCCVDFSKFQEIPAPHEKLRFEMVYAGSVTGLYMLEEMAHFFLELKNKKPDAFFRVLTVSPAQAAASVLRKAGLSDSDFYVGAADPKEVPGYLCRARIGISFRKPTVSQIAASPTKISEYLAAGLPVVSNAGTGDIDELFETERVGVTLDSFDRDSYQRAVDRILELEAEEDIRTRCRETSVRNFDLVNVGGKRYYEVYKKLQQTAD